MDSWNVGFNDLEENAGSGCDDREKNERRVYASISTLSRRGTRDEGGGMRKKRDGCAAGVTGLCRAVCKDYKKE
jgi:hypothetical protein